MNYPSIVNAYFLFCSLLDHLCSTIPVTKVSTETWILPFLLQMPQIASNEALLRHPCHHYVIPGSVFPRPTVNLPKKMQPWLLVYYFVTILFRIEQNLQLSNLFFLIILREECAWETALCSDFLDLVQNLDFLTSESIHLRRSKAAFLGGTCSIFALFTVKTSYILGGKMA